MTRVTCILSEYSTLRTAQLSLSDGAPLLLSNYENTLCDIALPLVEEEFVPRGPVFISLTLPQPFTSL
jgi:hypothetical protein